jgi:hypothetical protein
MTERCSKNSAFLDGGVLHRTLPITHHAPESSFRPLRSRPG